MITGQIIGGAQVQKNILGLAPSIKSQLKVTVQRLTLELLTKVKAEKLSGQVLRVRTGRLRRSITYDIIETPTEIGGVVGTNVSYAKAHEFGFTGVVSVRAHLRAAKDGAAHSVVGHSRRVNLPERSFLRSSLKEMDGKIRHEIELTLNNVARGFNK